MPIFMDRHDVPGLTAMDVAEGHKRDLEIQHKFGCRALTYWYDETRDVAFCLIEAPRKEAVRHLHDSAHGLIPHQIIEVESHVVESFLGRVSDPDAGGDAGTQQRIGPAFRTILLTELKNAVPLIARAGRSDTSRLLQTHNEIIRNAFARHRGREVEHKGGMMAVFSSVIDAVACALTILSRIKTHNRHRANTHLQVAVGLSAGDPVTDREDFFGEAVQFAQRLCFLAAADELVMASVVRDHYRQQGDDLSSGDHRLRILRPDDEAFIDRLMDVAENIWTRDDFSVVDFSRRLGLSKSQMYRRITEVTGFSPNDFIKEFRLRQSLGLIEGRRLNIAQIAYECGFSSPSYFSKCFQKRFGVVPSVYADATA